jgi:protein-tyrosine-phosphatase
MTDMKRIVFVCVENSCRSQIAEAYARILGAGDVDVYSAGSRPSGEVNPKAIIMMKEVGYDLNTHGSKGLDELPAVEFDAAITMGCGDECPNVKAKLRADWGIPDPKHMDQEAFREVRDLICEKVRALLAAVNV